MKIRKLKIKNYKIFDDVEFDFTDAEGKTLDTIVLAGVNGCGKTTVLEIIKEIFLGNNLSNGKIGAAEVSFDLQLSDLEIDTLISRVPPISSSRNDMRSPEILKKLREKNLVFTNFERYASVKELKDLSVLPLPLFNILYFPVSETKQGKNVNGLVHVVQLMNHKVEMKSNLLKYALDEVFKNKTQPPKNIIEQQIKEVTTALSDLESNTRLVDLESEELVFESANGQRIYFEQLSHGEQHLYFRAIYLNQMNLKNTIIMVDEPEAAFHPTWQQKIAQLYRNVGENNQVFLATHSPHIMASVPPECLFILHIDESEGKRKIEVINAAKAGKHSQGLEPNRILKEVMQVETLREWQTQRDIDRMATLLTLEHFESEEAAQLSEKLTDQLGRQDPFIIRMEHQQMILRRKKETPAQAAA